MVNLARVKQIQERFDRATYLTVYTRGEFGYNDSRKSFFVRFNKMFTRSFVCQRLILLRVGTILTTSIQSMITRV